MEGTEKNGLPGEGFAGWSARELADRMQEGFFLCRAEGNGEVLYANKAVLRMFGCGSKEEFSELTGSTFLGMVHPGDADEVREELLRQTGDGPETLEYRILRRDGEERPVEERRYRERTEDGRTVCSVFLRETGEEREERPRNAERREAPARAPKQDSAAAEGKDAFLSDMAHHIRAPMNAVVGYAALAKKNMEDPRKVRGYLEQIENAGRGMLKLIGDVLELSQLGESGARSREEPCDLLEVLHAVQERTAPQAAEKGIQLSVGPVGLHHHAVYGDPQRMESVLLQLVTNAVRCTGNGGSVWISAAEKKAPDRDSALFTFTVEDTGIGIEAEELPRLFEPFRRKKQSVPGGRPGMGLGLPLAKGMVELMGGTLTVRSRVDHGSVFTVTLPLKLREEEPEKEPDLAALKIGFNTRKILLAEDNPINRELCSEILLAEGFEVDAAENGKAAVEMLEASRPGEYALVLMDIRMPVMDGTEAARAIRALPDPALASIPIVALSANSMEDDRKRSMESGMNAHLSKPIQVEELLSLLDCFSWPTAES